MAWRTKLGAAFWVPGYCLEDTEDAAGTVAFIYTPLSLSLVI